MTFISSPLERLYAEHLDALMANTSKLLATLDLDGVVISSGNLEPVFDDDSFYPYRANAHFKAWVPLLEHPGCAILFRPGAKPTLFYLQPQDYWHKPPEDPSGFWPDRFDIHPIKTTADAHNRLGPTKGLAFIGDGAAGWGIDRVNPEALLNALHYLRPTKSDYEKRCILEANRTAVRGHRAAEAAFFDGASEFEILNRYLGAIGQLAEETPYPSIIATNENCAVLHYQHYRRQRDAEGESRSLLIDAGANHLGYAADITRTHACRPGPFGELLAAMEEEQQAIIDEIRPGLPYPDLHAAMQLRIAALLNRFDLVRLDPAAMVEENIVFTFMPHGLGHYLGLQTHDQGGQLFDGGSRQEPPPPASPALRITRSIEEDQIFTIEPGLYFIPSLLEELHASRHGAAVNWELIASLMPYGGIRIEDNVLIHEGKVVNLTRTSFAELEE